MAESTSDPAIRGLTAEQVESFNANGFLGPFDLYAEQEAPLVWSQAMTEMVTSANKPQDSTTITCDRHLDCDTLSRDIAQPAIVHKLRSLMGDDIMCWKTHIFEKEPGTSGTGWHQVEAFPAYTEESTAATQELFVWTAFSETDKEHGCLRFLPGSHKQSYNVENKSHNGYDYAELKLDSDWDPNSHEIVDLELKAGQFVIFLATCVHASHANTSAARRVGLASRYVSPSVRVYGDSIDLDHHGCVMVSGEDRYGHNRMYRENLNGFPFLKVE
ncbi:phytanoyl-CoA dioxygenase family protein [Dactylosporangium sp. NPDC051541]|uniref:phytanoyl-CoA dioxygenase family protein n=1 Tax=Dactylosporangium sp. NPDC051541 TaxID=3363977 RepID=UPI0037A5ECEF